MLVPESEALDTVKTPASARQDALYIIRMYKILNTCFCTSLPLAYGMGVSHYAHLVAGNEQ